jgi:uncharacterized protein (TIGR03382 family)
MNQTRTTTTALMMIAGLALAGCDGPELHDDIDLELDFKLTPSDELHLPYVAGSTVRITATDGDADDERDRFWTLESSDESILRIDQQTEGTATCLAMREGFVTMRVFDEEGEMIHDAEIEVAQPDRVQLLPHGPLIVGIETPVEDSGINILSGGEATMLVRYFRGDQVLFGNGALRVETSSPDITAHPETTFVFENREWLQVTPNMPGSHEVALFVGDVSLGTLAVEARTVDEVESIELIEEQDVDFSDVEDGRLMTALGMARLEDGEPIYGVELTWDLDGDGEPGTGDLFRYEFVEDAVSVLGVEFDGMRAEVEIHGEEGFVDSSNDLGCSTSGRGSSSGATFGLGVLLALGASLRRRKRLVA